MKTYACWRVSTNEQNEARQLKAFRECGEVIDEIFGDKMSGKNMNRPGYQKMLSKLEPGDLVIFSSLDRMSRSYEDTAEEWRRITKEKGCDILILDKKDLLDTRLNKDLLGTFISDMVVSLLSYVSQTERENIKKRQEEGIAAMPVVNGKKVSTKTGRTYGRPIVSMGDDFEKFLKKQKDGEMTVAECCEALGIGRSTWYARCKEAI